MSDQSPNLGKSAASIGAVTASLSKASLSPSPSSVRTSTNRPVMPTIITAKDRITELFSDDDSDDDDEDAGDNNEDDNDDDNEDDSDDDNEDDGASDLMSGTSSSPPVNRKNALADARAAADRKRADAFGEHCISLDRAIPWFDDDSVQPRPVPNHGIVADFSLSSEQKPDGEPSSSKSRSAAVGAAKRPFSNTWVVLWCHFALYEISGDHAGKYVCWVLRTTAKQDSLWRGLLADSSLLKFWEANQAQLAPLANPVFVEKTNGGAFGAYAAALVSERRRLPGLFVQTYGYRNAVPCEACERNYRRYVNPGFTSGSTDQNPFRVMVPFFDCVSLPGFSQGVCGNCLYYVGGAACSYHKHPPKGAPPAWVGPLRANETVEAAHGPRRLSLSASPISGPELSAPLLRKKTANAKARGWMGSHLAFGRSSDWEGATPTLSTGAVDQTPGPPATTSKQVVVVNL